MTWSAQNYQIDKTLGLDLTGSIIVEGATSKMEYMGFNLGFHR